MCVYRTDGSANKFPTCGRPLQQHVRRIYVGFRGHESRTSPGILSWISGKFRTAAWSTTGIQYGVVTVDLYSASSQTRLWCATASRKSALISASQSVQPGTSTTLQDHGYGLVYRAMCLYSASFRRVLIPACHIRRAQAEYDPGACSAEVVYPSKDRHPPRH